MAFAGFFLTLFSADSNHSSYFLNFHSLLLFARRVRKLDESHRQFCNINGNSSHAREGSGLLLGALSAFGFVVAPLVGWVKVFAEGQPAVWE
jgi:hypothetical protein